MRIFLGFQVLWECGGTLAAPAIAAGVIHKALAFIAPKLVRFCSMALRPTTACLFSYMRLYQGIACSHSSNLLTKDVNQMLWLHALPLQQLFEM